MIARDLVPLAPLTSLGIGGPARRLVSAYTEDELVAALGEGAALVLGGGSNVVLPDAGVDGTVVRVATHGRQFRRDGSSVVVEVAAGEDWDDLVAELVAEELAGVECLAGIPGLSGSTPVQNVGAYGQEVAQCVDSVRAYDREARAVVTLRPDDCGFGYRTSVFKAEPGRWVVLAVSLRLEPRPTSLPLRYAELAAALSVPVGGSAPLGEVRQSVLGLRRAKGMVLDPADPDTRSAGSFFLNPVLEESAAAPLRDAPSYPTGDGRVKVSAAWLIEQAGFTRGYARGRVGISGKHSLALVNRGGATAADLLGLAREVRDGVADRFGVALEPEPVLVGAQL